MKKVTLGKTQLDVTPLGFGGAPIGYLSLNQDRITTLLSHILDCGLNLIDTSACYPGSEEAIGNAIGTRRSEYVLVTKCGHKVGGVQGQEWSAKLIGHTVDRALKRLRTDCIDVMLLHSCSLNVLKRGEALEALVKARDAGKIRFAGYSGDNEAAEFAVELADIAVIQASVNICDQKNIETVIPKAREHNVGVIAKRPIANAAWKDPSTQAGVYYAYARTYTERLAKMGIHPRDLGFEGLPDQVWPEIALRFTLSLPDVQTAIVGTTNPEHLKANVEAAERGPLPEEVVEKIQAAFKTAESKSGGKWIGEN